ncbi:MAG: leucine-rich repeat domain-containing protein [Lachnospiraceae bacterium]|nr:leucine-rich repeat domain-containing protein [Lachnospiraceae bacterium]
MKMKKYIWGFLFMAVLLSLSGIGTLQVEAAKKEKQSKYFMAEDIYYKIIAKDRVAACGLKLKKDKKQIHDLWKSDTLWIPPHVIYKGKKYKVTEMADYTYRSHDGPPEWDSEEYVYGQAEGINLPAYRLYHYVDFPNLRLDDWDFCEFQRADNIKTVILPDTLTYIGEGAFCRWPKLKKVVFAKKYKKLTIGINAFAGLKWKSITFPEGTYELKRCAAGSIPEITIPSTVKKIGAEVVNADTKKVTISKKNKKFKMKDGILYSYDEKQLLGASANVKSSVSISKKTRSIAKNAFARTNVKQVNLRNQIKSIPKGAFAYCKKLEKVSGTNAVTKIDYAAFTKCKKLKTIGKVPKLKHIARAAFWQNKKLKIHLSSTIKDIEEYAFGCKEYACRIRVSVAAGNPYFFVKDGVLIKKDGEEQTLLIQTGIKEKEGLTILPEGITNIPVAVSILNGDGIIFPTTLKQQDGKVFAEAAPVVYQTMEPPDFGKYYSLSEDKATIYVPKGAAIDTYKKMISDVYNNKDDSSIYIWKEEGGQLKIMEIPEKDNNESFWK